jgi:molybdopterin adenylyltransferase
METHAIRCAVLTVSDRCARGERPDESGPAVCALLASWGWGVERSEILPDEEGQVADRLAELAAEGFDFVVTTGGTGLAPRDRTPEATLRVADRLVPGLAELVRSRTGAEFPRAYLSRGVVALRGRCLLVNLPGSPRGAQESLTALREVLPHAFEVLRERSGGPGAHETGD